MKHLIISRSFWAALLTLFTVIAGAFIPDFNLNIEDAAGLAIIATAYLVGIAVDPGPGGWRSIVLSRKFWAAVIGFAIVILNAFKIALPFDLTTEQLVSIAVVIAGYIASAAVEGPPLWLRQAQPEPGLPNDA